MVKSPQSSSWQNFGRRYGETRAPNSYGMTSSLP